MLIRFAPLPAITCAAALLIGCGPKPHDIGHENALAIPSSQWRDHVEKELLPYWTMPSATKGDASTPFPTYRCKDGKAYGEPGCSLESGEYKSLSDIDARVRASQKTDGPYEWILGPRNELLKRTFVRMHARQTYVYVVAYNMTGKPEYLELAHRGVTWLLQHAVDSANGSYTFVADGRPDPDPEYRTSQDQSYTLLGLAAYYYLTRDAKVLHVLTDLKDKVKEKYMSPGWEDGRLIRWMLKDRMEPKPTCLSTVPAPDKGTNEQKELVALLDQVNAYMLLTTTSVPEVQRSAWLDDLHSMARTIEDRFYNDGTKQKDQRKTGIDPVVPTGMFAGCLTYKGPPAAPKGSPFCVDGGNPPPIDPENCDPANHHTDFGHSIKSFWMLYLIGREKGDSQMVRFAVEGAENLFSQAYLDNGTWARAKRPATAFDPNHPRFEIDRNKEWWIYAELDQMAGTMALRAPKSHVDRLNTTYKYWLSSFVSDGMEVSQWKYDSCPNASDKNCSNDAIPKANLWKNGFHSMEHALVAYITTSGVEKKPLKLYYALAGREFQKLQPYYYKASVSSKDLGAMEVAGRKFQRIEATFTDIR